MIMMLHVHTDMRLAWTISLKMEVFEREPSERPYLTKSSEQGSHCIRKGNAYCIKCLVTPSDIVFL